MLPGSAVAAADLGRDCRTRSGLPTAGRR